MTAAIISIHIRSLAAIRDPLLENFLVASEMPWYSAVLTTIPFCLDVQNLGNGL